MWARSVLMRSYPIILAYKYVGKPHRRHPNGCLRLYRSNGGSEYLSQSTIPEPPPFNDPNYETYYYGRRNGSKI
jgi:hypothetical protein